jgi:hypothetical protein
MNCKRPRPKNEMGSKKAKAQKICQAKKAKV